MFLPMNPWTASSNRIYQQKIPSERDSTHQRKKKQQPSLLHEHNDKNMLETLILRKISCHLRNDAKHTYTKRQPARILIPALKKNLFRCFSDHCFIDMDTHTTFQKQNNANNKTPVQYSFHIPFHPTLCIPCHKRPSPNC